MRAILSVIKNPAWDVALILFLVASGFFLGMSKGKKKLAMGMLGIYVTTVLFPYLPLNTLISGRSSQEEWMFKAGVFLALSIFISLFLIRSFRGTGGDGLWWEVLILSVMSCGLFVSSILNLASPELINSGALRLSPLTLKIFASPQILPWWIIVPIFGILFL